MSENERRNENEAAEPTGCERDCIHYRKITDPLPPPDQCMRCTRVFKNGTVDHYIKS